MAALARLFGKPSPEPEDAAATETGPLGLDSSFGRELRSAAEAAVQCNRDPRQFLNECEPVMARFIRAVHHVRQRRFQDEREVLESVEQREEIIHFLFDCVRNRFPLRGKAAYAKTLLEEGSPAWKRAFTDHLRRCATCATVLLDAATSSPAPPREPEQREPDKKPIPFVLEVVSLLALLAPVVLLAPGCDCRTRWILTLVGAVAVLQWLLLEVVRWLVPPAQLLRHFIAGNYAIGVRHRPLGCAWRPSRTHLLCEHDGETATLAAPSCHSFGWWSRQPRLPVGATIRRRKRLQGEAAPVSGRYPIGVAVSGWSQAAAELCPDGAVLGLPVEAHFDGSALLVGPSAGPAGQQVTWAKLGPWRWDLFYKVLVALGMLGFLTVVLMAAVPPGLSLECLTSRDSTWRWPLRAVFLLDGSGSVSRRMWEAEKDSAARIIRTFQDVYGDSAGLLHFGVVQFSSYATLEVPLSSDAGAVLQALAGVPQRSGGTLFRSALDLCRWQMGNYTQAGSQTFDVCVLLTDGQSEDPPGSLQGLLPPDAAIFGIYAGTEETAKAELKQLSTCGAARISPGCRFFASATDFAAVAGETTKVALAVTSGSDAAVGASCPQPLWWSLAFPLAVLPAMSWWIYLQWRRCRSTSGEGETAKPAPKVCIRQPLRLHAAGKNEGRSSTAFA